MPTPWRQAEGHTERVASAKREWTPRGLRPWARPETPRTGTGKSKERRALNDLSTTFHLPDEAIDRLRAAAATIILKSPDLIEVLREEAAIIQDATTSEGERR